MIKLIEKIPGLIAIILVFVSLLLVVSIYLGGNSGSIIDSAGEAITVPKFTDALLYWTYALMGLSVCITLFMALLNSVKSFISNPRTGLKSLIPIVLFILIFVVAWNLGSGEKISIIGYEGTENQGYWAQFTDMVIYTSYALFAAIAVTIIGAQIYVRLK